VTLDVLIFKKNKKRFFLQYQLISTYTGSIQINLKDNKIVSGLKHNIFYFIFILMTCFGQLTIIRPALQNLE